MAKKFLESMGGEAYGDDVLADLIPVRRSKSTTPKPKTNSNKPSRPETKRSSGGRKKRFLDSIDKQMQNSRPERKTTSKGGRKSFLDTIEEALDNNVFDEIIPEKPLWAKKQKSQTEAQKREEMERFSTMITKEVLDRAREIAKQKGIRVKDVINTALRYYVEKES
ncbi:MAG: hypothetical protein AAFN10_03585 [Bacteroidota bacterium]